MRTLRIWLFAFASMCLFGPTAPAREPAPSTEIQAVQAALRARDYDKALRLAKLALQKHPDDIRLLTIEGIALQLKDQRAAALAVFNHILKLSPNLLPVLEGKAQIEYQERRNEEAKITLQRILTADPGNETAHAMLGVIAAQTKNCELAATHFEQAGSALSSNQLSLQMYGNCLEHLERSAKAIPVFQKLLVMTPSDRNARYNLALVQFYGGDSTGSLLTLQPLLDEENPDPEALSLASDAYESEGNTPKAVELLREAIMIRPTEPTYYLSFAALAFDHASYQVGVDMIDAGLRHIPSDDSLYATRGLLHVQLGEYDAADRDFRKADELNPGKGMGDDAQSLLEASKTDPEHILDNLQDRLEVRPNDPFLHFLLAKVVYERGPSQNSPEFKQALESARRSVLLDPTLVYARLLLSSLYLDAGEREMAIAECRAAVRLAPNDQTAIYHLIMALRKTGNTEEIPILVNRLVVARKNAEKLENDRKRMQIMDSISPKRH